MKQPDLWVLVDDVARAAVSPINEYVAGKTFTDALGRGWVSDAYARVALAKAEQAWQQELADRGAYDAWLKDRVQRRRALVEKVRDKVLAGGQATPASSSEIFERRRVVLEKFHEREPELGFYEWRDKRKR